MIANDKNTQVINLVDVVGKGYKTFWNSKKRYLVVKGSRGSKKSKTTALKLIWLLLKYPKSNILVVRKVKDTLRDSCYKELIWAIETFKVSRYFKIKKNPLEIEYTVTGQKILFRGLDDPLKLTSITVGSGGYLNFVWIEEAYELKTEDEFDKLDMSIRGQLPDGYFKQIIITFNPYSDKHWLKKRFFDKEDEDVCCLTTNYMCNEFLGEDDIRRYEKMKVDNPKRYNVEGLGNWGIVDGLVYENWFEMEFDYKDLLTKEGYSLRLGLDFGYSHDPAGFVACLVNENTKEIYIFDEFYHKGLTNDRLALMIKNKGYSKDKIIADSAEPKSIEELKRHGIRRIHPAVKGKDSVIYGIQRLQQYKIIVHPKCQSTLMEFSLYCWDKKNDVSINKPVDMNNHILDALRYAVVTLDKPKGVDTTRKVIY